MCAPARQCTEERGLQRRLCAFFAANHNIEPARPRNDLLLPLALVATAIPAIWQLFSRWRRGNADRRRLEAYAEQVEEQLRQLAAQRRCIEEQEKVIGAHQVRIQAQEVRIQAQMAHIDAEQGIAEQWRSALQRTQSEALEATAGANRRLLDALCDVLGLLSSNKGSDDVRREVGATLTSSTCSPARDATPAPEHSAEAQGCTQGVNVADACSASSKATPRPAAEVTAARALAMWERMASDRQREMRDWQASG